MMHRKLSSCASLIGQTLQACTEDLDQLRHEHSAEQAAHTALREEAGKLRGRLLELGGVEEKLATLQQQHTAAEAKLEVLEQEKLVSTVCCSLQDVLGAA
jgi:DNA repair exonuclease SbcCD ATPase subunit